MVVFQKPNAIFIVAAVASFLAILFHRTGAWAFFAALAAVAWSAWGYDELVYGESQARRLFGLAALLGVLFGLTYSL